MIQAPIMTKYTGFKRTHSCQTTADVLGPHIQWDDGTKRGGRWWTYIAGPGRCADWILMGEFSLSFWRTGNLFLKSPRDQLLSNLGAIYEKVCKCFFSSLRIIDEWIVHSRATYLAVNFLDSGGSTLLRAPHSCVFIMLQLLCAGVLGKRPRIRE